MNIIEVLNEATIFVLSYFCIAFSDYKDDFSLQETLGMLYVCVILTVIFINIIAMIFRKRIERYLKLK